MSPQKWLFSDLPPPCYHLSLIHLTPLPHVTGKIMTNYFWEFKYWESHLIMATEVKRDSESFKSQKQQTQQNTTSYIYIEFPKFKNFFHIRYQASPAWTSWAMSTSWSSVTVSSTEVSFVSYYCCLAGRWNINIT